MIFEFQQWYESRLHKTCSKNGTPVEGMGLLNKNVIHVSCIDKLFDKKI